MSFSGSNVFYLFQLAEAPSAHKEAVSKSTEEDEIEKQLAKLKAP